MCSAHRGHKKVSFKLDKQETALKSTRVGMLDFHFGLGLPVPDACISADKTCVFYEQVDVDQMDV
jgi:hypothetical protein